MKCRRSIAPAAALALGSIGWISVGAMPCLGQVVVQQAPTAPVRDSTARQPADTTRHSTPTLPKPVVPLDSTLAAACAGAGDIASDLVVVVFEAGTDATTRAAAVKRAGGVLLPRPGAAPDEFYVRLDSGANVPSAQALADRLIQLAQVRSVSLAPCPPPAPAPPRRAPPSAPRDTGRAARP